MNLPEISTSTLATIEKYDGVVLYVLTAYRERYNKELINSQSKATVNKAFADALNAASEISVRPKWISDLRTGVLLPYDKVHKVFTATNNFLRKHEFRIIPDEAMIVT